MTKLLIELPVVIFAVLTLIHALVRMRRERAWFKEDEQQLIGWLRNRDEQIAAEKKDNDHFREIVPSQIAMLNERNAKIRKMGLQLANRKGQITRMRNEQRRRGKGIYQSNEYEDGSRVYEPLVLEFSVKGAMYQKIVFHSDIPDRKAAIKAFEKITGLKVQNGGAE